MHAIEHTPSAQGQSLADFSIKGCIGRGNNAKAFLAKRRTSETRVIRAIRKYLTISNDEVPRVFAHKQILSLPPVVEHPFIVGLESTFQTDSCLCFVTEYAPGGDLMHHVQRGALGFPRARSVNFSIFDQADFGIIHRGISLDNILLTREGHTKLIGFSSSKFTTGRTHSFVGSAELMAPEILRDEEYGFAVDWWAFGVALYQMLLQRSPFQGDDEDEIYDAILSEEPVYPPDLSSEARSLLQGLLKREPQERLGSEDETAIREHPFFTGLNWEQIAKQEIEPPFKPGVVDEYDMSNFDIEFTKGDIADLAAEETEGLSEEQQKLFEGF